jgi:hypothetical protein
LVTTRNTPTEGHGLTIFDIDDTLFYTTAEIKVMVGNQCVRTLTSSEFNTYKLKPGERYDFSEFRSATQFARTSKPIVPVLNKAKAILRNVKKKGGSKMILLTAREDFDDKETFLQTFRNVGLDIDAVHVERAGNLRIGAAAGKEKVIRRYLDNYGFKRVRMFDDATGNLDSFLAIQKYYPEVLFEAYLVNPKNGTISRYN